MGNCQNIQKIGREMINSCCSTDTTEEQNDVKCGREYIDYYLDNKIEKFYINFNKHVLIDKSDKSYSVEIEPSRVYFEIMKRHSKNIDLIITKCLIKKNFSYK